ncbi:MAG: M13 family metallopeptidase [Pseudomonadota bacterium]
MASLNWVRGAVAATLFLAAGACASGNRGAAPSAVAQFGAWGVETVHLSDEIAPGDDFYVYVNAGWLESTPMPQGRTVYGEPWAAQARLDDEIYRIITEPDGPAAPATAEKRVRDLFRSYMNTDEIERRGLAPVLENLRAVAALETYDDVAAFMADPRSSSIFYLLIKPPVDMRGGYVLTIDQYRVTGLGLPAQDYYNSDAAPFPAMRAAYLEYVADTLARAGVDRAAERARDVLALETGFAGVMWDLARLRDAGAAFNMIPTAKLDQYAPGFPWGAYLEARGVADLQNINIGLGALQESAALFETFSVDAWRSYLAFHWLNNHADVLPEAFGAAAFAFYETTLYDVSTRAPRERRAVDFVQGRLRDDVGAVYVSKRFSSDYVQFVEEMADYVKRAFRERLLEADWMDPPTRAEALAKLDAVVFEVGEPKAGVDWSGLETAEDDLFGNVQRIADYQWAASRARIGAPVTRYGDWNMGAHRVGLGYHQQYNKIFLTAGALFAPFFDPAADPAVNFGSLGVSIAHEFGHALDDQGAKFDRRGALRDWWTPTARAGYETRIAKLKTQYGGYEVAPGVRLAAEQMIGEIVGDLVGTSVGYRAYELYAQERYDGAPPVIDGFTGAQRFFLGSAQHQRLIATDDAMRAMARRQTHPPSKFRVNGVVRNTDAWYDAFDVSQGDAMYLPPSERVRLW